MKYFRSWKADGPMVIDLAVPRKPENLRTCRVHSGLFRKHMGMHTFTASKDKILCEFGTGYDQMLQLEASHS